MLTEKYVCLFAWVGFAAIVFHSTKGYKKYRGGSMRAIILPYGHYNVQGMYCGMSTASEVFLIFTIPI